MNGWIKLHRKVMKSSMYRQLNSKQRDVMLTILLLANHESNTWEFRGDVYEVKPGQFITSLDSLKEHCASDVTTQNIRTALLKLEKHGFLTNESTKKNRLITVVNWGTYQACDDATNKEINRQPTNNQQTANKQLTTNKNIKKEKNDYIVEIVEYLNEKTGANFSSKTKKTVDLINGRLNEGRSIEDFKRVIDTKTDEWLGKDQEMYLRPNTLFTPSNFENYLNQAKRRLKSKTPQLDLYTPSREEMNFLDDIYKRRSETGASE